MRVLLYSSERAARVTARLGVTARVTARLGVTASERRVRRVADFGHARAGVRVRGCAGASGWALRTRNACA